jgi:hypothetical protein
MPYQLPYFEYIFITRQAGVQMTHAAALNASVCGGDKW